MKYYLDVRCLMASSFVDIEMVLFNLMSTSNPNLETDFPLIFTELIYFKFLEDRIYIIVF